MVRDEGTRHCSARNRLHHRRLDFDVAARIEERPNRLHQFAARNEHIAHLWIHIEVNVALTIAQFNIRQSVILLRKREQILRQKCDLFHVH